MNWPVLQSFGARVRAERERFGMSQETLADRAGLHRTYVGGIERGERNVGLLNIARLARALGISPHVLLLEIEDWSPTEPQRGEGSAPRSSADEHRRRG